jgi:hypothetical protein
MSNSEKWVKILSHRDFANSLRLDRDERAYRKCGHWDQPDAIPDLSGLENCLVFIPLEKSSDEVEDVTDDRPINPASKRFDLLASRLTL